MQQEFSSNSMLNLYHSKPRQWLMSPMHSGIDILKNLIITFQISIASLPSKIACARVKFWKTANEFLLSVYVYFGFIYIYIQLKLPFLPPGNQTQRNTTGKLNQHECSTCGQ